MKKFENAFSGFDTMHERDRQTTSRHAMTYTVPRLCIASCGNKRHIE